MHKLIRISVLDRFPRESQTMERRRRNIHGEDPILQADNNLQTVPLS